MSGARRWIIGGAGLAGLTVAAAAVSYPWLFRRTCLTWGATPEEVTGELPGDDLLPNPDILTTRAITIDAPPAAVWPWLVQMGSGRGGAYTYDWIENLFGLDMHSADEILPQFQDLKVGDELPLGPEAPAPCGWRFSSRNGRWCSAPRTETGSGRSRCIPEGRRTRLVSRNRISTPDARPFQPARRRLGHGAGQPGHGAQDAAGYQGTGGAPGGRRRHDPRGNDRVGGARYMGIRLAMRTVRVQAPPLRPERRLRAGDLRRRHQVAGEAA